MYGELLHKVSWAEYLYLLFKLDKPTKWQTEMLERIAVAIANPGIREYSVRAAMNAGAGGSTSASALMAALAVGAGSMGGGREIFVCMNLWQTCGQDIKKWKKAIKGAQELTVDSWPVIEHPPGYDPNGVSCATTVKQVLTRLAEIDNASHTKWLKENRSELEEIARKPLAVTGIISAAFHDIGFSSEESEMLYLLLRLPGAAAHCLEQKKLGYKKYPFFLGRLSVKKESDG